MFIVPKPLVTHLIESCIVLHTNMSAFRMTGSLVASVWFLKKMKSIKQLLPILIIATSIPKLYIYSTISSRSNVAYHNYIAIKNAVVISFN